MTGPAALPDPLLVLGGSGLVGSRLVREWRSSVTVLAPGHRELDVLDEAALRDYVAVHRPRGIVNAVAWADVDGAEAQRGDRDGLTYRLNARLPERLAQFARLHESFLVHISTDYVFDGTQSQRAYREDDAMHPLGWYAQSKADGEEAVSSLLPHRAAIVRIEMPFTAAKDAPKLDVSRLFRARVLAGEPIVAVVDQNITPVLIDDLARAFDALVRRQFAGRLHVAASTCTTPYRYASAIAEHLGGSARLIQPTTFAQFVGTRAARRPQHSWLDVSRFQREFGTDILRSFDEQLASWAADASAAAV